MISMRVLGADAGIAEGPHDLEPGGHAGDPVKASTGGNRVAVRTDGDDAERGIGALEPADQVTRGVDPGDQSGFGKFLGEPGAAFEKQRGE